MATDHSLIERERDAAQPDAALVQEYRIYVAGDNVLVLSDDQKEFLAGLLEHEFVDNIADALVATASDRMELKRWKVENKPVADFLFELAIKNQLRALQADVNYAGLRDGNTAVILGWDGASRRVTLSHEDWWNGAEGMLCLVLGLGPGGVRGQGVEA